MIFSDPTPIICAACLLMGLFMVFLSRDFIKRYLQSETFAKWHEERKKLSLFLGIALILYALYKLYVLLTG